MVFGYSFNFLPAKLISPVCCASSKTRSTVLESEVGLWPPELYVVAILHSCCLIWNSKSACVVHRICREMTSLNLASPTRHRGYFLFFLFIYLFLFFFIFIKNIKNIRLFNLLDVNGICAGIFQLLIKFINFSFVTLFQYLRKQIKSTKLQKLKTLTKNDNVNNPIIYTYT